MAVLVWLAFACLAFAFLTNDFSVVYVASNSHTDLPTIYRFTAVWGGHEGSLLLWVQILALWTVAVATFSRQLPDETVARVLGVMAQVEHRVAVRGEVLWHPCRQPTPCWLMAPVVRVAHQSPNDPADLLVHRQDSSTQGKQQGALAHAADAVAGRVLDGQPVDDQAVGVRGVETLGAVTVLERQERGVHARALDRDATLALLLRTRPGERAIDGARPGFLLDPSSDIDDARRQHTQAHPRHDRLDRRDPRGRAAHARLLRRGRVVPLSHCF